MIGPLKYSNLYDVLKKNGCSPMKGSNSVSVIYSHKARQIVIAWCHDNDKQYKTFYNAQKEFCYRVGL